MAKKLKRNLVPQPLDMDDIVLIIKILEYYADEMSGMDWATPEEADECQEELLHIDRILAKF